MLRPTLERKRSIWTNSSSERFDDSLGSTRLAGARKTSQWDTSGCVLTFKNLRLRTSSWAEMPAVSSKLKMLWVPSCRSAYRNIK